MVVGVLKLQFQLFGVTSLKEKRKVVKGIVGRIRSQFDAAAAETGLNDLHQSAEVGVTIVGNDARLINSRLDKIVDAVEAWGLAVLSGSEMEIIHV
ncbi:DUF503 domain-containing protein [Desulfoluna butyratoxydans]|uniref:DUF503 domain-containing protein n=1 Tax=Desulfoluna butyratoxydans TaxID=231438 RepID=A0A4V6IL36_9BACT|nr:DUF503 domain-containing protein [Desulfoluna butyratoxydans]VFQ43568.1 protein of unknown function duf503 [Desulfoluna butyratoxydans]